MYNKSKWTNEIGFFGYTTTGALIKDLTIKDSFIWGDKYVGGLIGTAHYPVLNGQKVNYGYENCQSTEKNYSNDVRYDSTEIAHQYGDDGICTLCGTLGGRTNIPFPISNATDLQKFANAVNNEGLNTLCAYLTADIDLNPDTEFNTRRYIYR